MGSALDAATATTGARPSHHADELARAVLGACEASIDLGRQRDQRTAGELAKLAQERQGTESEGDLDRLESGALASARPARPAPEPRSASASRHRARACLVRDMERCPGVADVVPGDMVIAALDTSPVGARGGEPGVGETPRAECRIDAVLLDDRLGGSDDLASAFAGRSEPGEVAPLARLRRARGLDLDRRRCGPRGEDPVLRLADELPAELGRAARIGQIAAPQRERGRGEMERDGLLRITDGLELEQRLAEQSSGAPLPRIARSRRSRVTPAR